MTDLNPSNDASSDQPLLDACLDGNPLAWQQFVDRFLPLVLLTLQQLEEQADRNWDVAEQHKKAIQIFGHLKSDEFQALKQRDPNLSMETWLIVVTRRLALADNTLPKLETSAD